MSLDVNRDLLDNMDYLNELARICKNKSKNEFDENLVYEVAFAHEYINSLILLDKNPSKDLIDIGVMFDCIMDMIDVKKLKKVKSDYKNLIKLKFKDVDSGSYMKDVKTTKSAVVVYFLRNMPRIATMSFFLVFFCSDGVSKLTSFLVDGVSEPLKSIEVTMRLCMGITTLVLWLFVILSMFNIMISLLYISLPIVRVTKFFDNFISSDTRECVRDIESGFEMVVSKVRDYDRIERNMLWLDTMAESKTGDIYLDSEIRRLHEKLSDSVRGKSYYYDVAKIELLHSMYLAHIGA